MKHRQHAKKVDANQKEIVNALRKIGCEVESLSGCAGMPDLLVALGNRIFLLEVKNVDGKNKVNDDQVAFHNRFPTSVVRNTQEALDVVTL
jgi:Holliday junction resolvase